MKISRSAIKRIKSLEVRGEITPDMVVDDAMDPESPLHKYFDWDVQSAARKHWRATARGLIKKVDVVLTTEEKVIRSVNYVRNPAKPKKEQGYISVEKASRDDDMAREILVEEFKRAGAALQKAQRLAEIFNCAEQVEEFARGINKLRKDVEEYRLNS